MLEELVGNRPRKTAAAVTARVMGGVTIPHHHHPLAFFRPKSYAGPALAAGLFAYLRLRPSTVEPVAPPRYNHPREALAATRKDDSP